MTPYSPLAAGFLTGKYTPDRSQAPSGSRFHVAPGHADIYFSDRNFRAVDRLRAKAAELGIPMVRLAMAWAMGHPAVASTLGGGPNDGALRQRAGGLRDGPGSGPAGRDVGLGTVGRLAESLDENPP